MVSDALIAGCIRKDPRAEHELYRALYPLMMGICSRYERNRQDATARMNEGFLKVLLNLAKRRPEVPFEAWVRRIIINTVIDGFRKEKERKTRESMDAPMDGHGSTEVNDYLRQMEAEAFAQLLHQVPDMSRKVFNLFCRKPSPGWRERLPKRPPYHEHQRGIRRARTPQNGGAGLPLPGSGLARRAGADRC